MNEAQENIKHPPVAARTPDLLMDLVQQRMPANQLNYYDKKILADSSWDVSCYLNQVGFSEKPEADKVFAMCYLIFNISLWLHLEPEDFLPAYKALHQKFKNKKDDDANSNNTAVV